MSGPQLDRSGQDALLAPVARTSRSTGMWRSVLSRYPLKPGAGQERWRVEVGESRYAVFRQVLAELGDAHLRADSGPD